MSSVVLDLQHDALDRNMPVSDILRKAFVIARKLGVKEFEEWTTKELNGYKSGKDIPEYRVARCQLKGWNPDYGWVPVLFHDASTAEKLSRRVCGQSIAELESLIESTTDDSPLQMPLPPKVYQNLCDALDYPTEILSFAPPTALIRILDAVRTILLNWSLKLEEDGILGVGLSFTFTEKQAAGENSYNVNNFYGPVHSPRIQQEVNKEYNQSTNFHAAVSRSNIAIHSTDVNQSIEPPDELSNLFNQMISALQSDASLNVTERSELISDIETLKAELNRTHPRTNMIGTIMSTLGNVSSITSFIMQITPYLPHLHP